ncbi:MAG TPA: hypothetical protein VHQ90_22215 [Thermoanaerobaculia bacterium]|nr:hypothetical protein [Thermoanaerobaculia bacterium]
MSRSLSRTVTALLLAATVMASPLLAAAPPARGVATHSATLAGAADFFAWLARWAVRLVAGDIGCGIDPNGFCRTGAAGAAARPATPRNGCGLDPNGHFRCDTGATAPVLPAGDNGCGLDPDGCHH